MSSELWLSLTMKIMALGHTLHDAQRIAAVILIECLVVYTIMGYRLRSDETDPSPAYFPARRGTAGVPAGVCGIFPAYSGTAADSDRALLFTQ
ncbi:MAG: hypothetical protein M0Q92_03560 [Methanoregula sp.]|jgi:hypothetical protein|nr:hypothetical protein [Methanoregula sp.]